MKTRQEWEQYFSEKITKEQYLSESGQPNSNWLCYRPFDPDGPTSMVAQIQQGNCHQQSLSGQQWSKNNKEQE